MDQFLSLLNNETLQLFLELLVIPALFAGPKYGIIRWLNWLKERFNLGGQKVLSFSVMRILAIVASILAAAVVKFAEGSLGFSSDPRAFVEMIAAFIAFSQVWYLLIERGSDLESLQAQIRGGALSKRGQ